MIKQTTKLNIYYCAGLDNAEVIAHSFRELFNNKKLREYLPEDPEEFKELKKEIYWLLNNQDFIDIELELKDYGLYITKRSLCRGLRHDAGLDDYYINKKVKDVQPVEDVEYEIDSNL